MGVLVDTMRHNEIFDAAEFNATGLNIDVVGAGATGSKVALELAKLGIEDVTVWDKDVIEPHNIPNQAFGNDQIGEKKVTALIDLIYRQTGHTYTPKNEWVDGTQDMSDIVYLLTDTMSSRKEIFEKAIKGNFRTQLMVETRMGPDNGRIYTINPQLPREIEGWENNLYSDDEAEDSACGGAITVGPTASIMASMAVWQLIRWFGAYTEHDRFKEEVLENEILLGLRGQMMVLPRQF
jgi:molybdopterin/thiamine biosynthesis adenylyltransferase